METRYTDSPETAAALLRAGGCVAFPTETVYGLGADARNETAIAGIYRAKNRPADNPLIVHLPHADGIGDVVAEVSPPARDLIAAFFPGPLTLVLPRHASIPALVSAGLGTVAVRVPALELARDFLARCGCPVAAPSANFSGRPSPTTWQAVRDDLDGRIDGVLCGPQAAAGLESTVVDCTGGRPLVLRPGALSLEALQSVVPETAIPETAAHLALRSPGTRHRHYAPRARVVLGTAPEGEAVEGPVAWIGVTVPPRGLAVQFLQGCVGLEGYAYELYHFFRRCDAVGVKTIVCETVEDVGMGRALNDRLRRAAAR